MSSTSGTAKPLLYAFWRSSCTYRVRIALNLKQIPYDIESMSIVKNLSEGYTQVNPMRQVPALEIDGMTLTQSLSILHYLEATRPHSPLLPADLIKRARMLEICEIINSGIQPLQNVNFIPIEKGKKGEWAQQVIARGFTAVEKLLVQTAGKYCVGDEITMADCLLVPQVFNARGFRLDLSPFSNIVRIDRELEDHAAFKASHPYNQPDCPPENKL